MASWLWRRFLGELQDTFKLFCIVMCKACFRAGPESQVHHRIESQDGAVTASNSGGDGGHVPAAVQGLIKWPGGEPR